MVVFKCKMCGGDLEVSENILIGTCSSCGSTMTLPKTSDERKSNLFNRANHFRRLNDFDKAIAAYESILNEDNTDAEAHFGVVLSNFGIEYVEDPKTHTRIPTCHRMQFESILSDADYLAALENAPDSQSRNLYSEEALKISEIQKGILAISKKEDKFDVFICYKESSNIGTRTQDSVIAQDLYYLLNKEGFKVFYSKITLEDKLGQLYEPYIFAALNSAKVMILVGTKTEYFNAVWVKNEWSRFLSLTKQDKSRLLIPCYRDMDPFDLPEAISVLQSQDMSKIGFTQDLVRGIKKVIEDNKQSNVSTISTDTSTNAPGLLSLLKRANLFLEDGDFKLADEYFNKVLDIDPECAKAYLGRLMVELKARNEAEIGQQKKAINQSSNYQKALRFGDNTIKTTLNKYNEMISARNEALSKMVKIGMEYQGGIIFYILKKRDIGFDPEVFHGLIASTEDQSSSIVWAKVGLNKKLLRGTLTIIGSGKANTDLIVSQNGVGDSCAAGVARGYQGGGYSDWYLPSKDELNELFKNKESVGGGSRNDGYWSSTEANLYGAWFQHFKYGRQRLDGKGNPQCVRAIRSF